MAEVLCYHAFSPEDCLKEVSRGENGHLDGITSMSRSLKTWVEREVSGERTKLSCSSLKIRSDENAM